MNKKSITVLGKLIALIAVALTVMIVSSGISVHADNGKKVRVTTAKELKAAIKNADVGTIILRTEAYIDITIKSAKGAKTKELIVDAKNANITNKAVFKSINVISANSYTENVSGNKISLSDNYMQDGFTVAKKKKVASLKLYSDYGSFDNCYTLRKGAKIGEVSLEYSGGIDPVTSTYNKSKRVLKIKCSDDTVRTYTIKLDKSGRIISFDCESDWPEADHDETYTYDSNGNIVKIVGHDNESGTYTTEITYSGNLMIKNANNGTYSSGAYTYEYDKKGRLIHREYTGVDSIDGQTFKYGSAEDFEYDKKGRRIYDRLDDPETGSFYENSYTYNSKGYRTEVYNNMSGGENIWKYEYDEAGNLIKSIYTSEGFSNTYEFEYDEFGVRFS